MGLICRLGEVRERFLGFSEEILISSRSYKSTIYTQLLVATGFLFASGTAEGAVLYNVNVNTMAISGATGNINFVLGPGLPPVDLLNVSLTNFNTMGGMIGGPPTIGGNPNTTGALPGTVTMDNTGVGVDYFQSFTFGTNFSFLLTLYGPAVDSPSLLATGGTTFGIALYDAAGITPLLTTDPFGFAATIEIAPMTGVITLNAFPPTIRGTPVVTFDPVPEPGTWMSVCGSLLALGIVRRRWAVRT